MSESPFVAYGYVDADQLPDTPLYPLPSALGESVDYVDVFGAVTTISSGRDHFGRPSFLLTSFSDAGGGFRSRKVVPVPLWDIYEAIESLGLRAKL
jgi:hypothetical protein